LPYAKRVAGHFGTVHHEGWIYGRDYLPGLKEVIASLEDLSLASEQVMLLHAAKMARERGVSLVLTGEGGIDEYMGSGTYMFMFNALRGKWSKLRRSPLFFRKFLFWTMERLKYGRPDGECYSYPREWLWWLAKDSGLFLMEGMMMSEMFLRRLMSGDFLKAHRGASPVRYWDPCYAEIREALPNAELMQEMAYCDWRTLISDILNMEDDKLGSALGMDIWPAIDPSLAEFLFRIPAEMKVAGGESKQLFKKAMDGKVPHDIAYRKKGGFSTVMVKFFHDEYPRYLRDAIEDSNLKASGVFNMERVEELIRLHESGKVDYTWPLLGLLMLFLWHRRWIE
jgi:asparagine synthase (glutamine-hydrolysing)